MSWIHRDDLVDLITQSLTNPAFSGVYNATAPKPVRMSELCSALGESGRGRARVGLAVGPMARLAQR